MDWDLETVAAGAALDAAVAALAAGVGLPDGARWLAFGAVVAAGLLGGYLAGRLAGGPWRRRTRHGLLAGIGGGAALAAATWWSLFPAAPDGALRPVNYLLANAGVPSALAAQFDAALAAVASLAVGVLYVVEGALAAGAASGGVEPPAVRE